MKKKKTYVAPTFYAHRLYNLRTALMYTGIESGGDASGLTLGSINNNNNSSQDTTNSDRAKENKINSVEWFKLMEL